MQVSSHVCCWSTVQPISVFTRSTCYGAFLVSQHLHCVALQLNIIQFLMNYNFWCLETTDLCRSTSTIQESLPLDWPRGYWTHGLGFQTIVTIMNGCRPPHQRPYSRPQLLVNILQKSMPGTASPALIICQPNFGENFY